MTNKSWVTKQVPSEKLQDLHLKIDGHKKGNEQLVVINGLQLGKLASDENKGHGISGIKIDLPSSEKPQVFVEYNKRIISEEVANSLGLEKD